MSPLELTDDGALLLAALRLLHVKTEGLGLGLAPAFRAIEGVIARQNPSYEVYGIQLLPLNSMAAQELLFPAGFWGTP